jgi:hypothetical protein
MSLSTTFLSRFFPPVAADPTRGRDPYTAACKVSVVEAAASCGVGMLSETRVPEESRTTWWSSTINNRICTLACVGRERQLGVAEDTQAQRYRTPSGVLRTCNTVGKRLSAHQPGIPSGAELLLRHSVLVNHRVQQVRVLRQRIVFLVVNDQAALLAVVVCVVLVAPFVRLPRRRSKFR